MTRLSGNRSIICFQFSTSFPKAIQFSAVLMSERSFVYNFNNKFALVHITANKEFSQSWDRNSNIILSKEIKNQHTKTWEMPKLKYHLMAAINQLTTPCLIGSWEDQNKFIINPHPHQTTKKKHFLERSKQASSSCAASPQNNRVRRFLYPGWLGLARKCEVMIALLRAPRDSGVAHNNSGSTERARKRGWELQLF